MSLNITTAKKLRKMKSKWKNLPPEEIIRREKELQNLISDEQLTTPNKGLVQIVAGKVKGFKIQIPPQAKPITSRMKTSLFDLLREDILDKRVLDLYAGSGSMGIEALSRGAKSCTFVDNSPMAQKLLVENLKKTGFIDNSEVIKMKVNAYLSTIPSDQYFDIIFMDPPYKEFKYKAKNRLIDIINLAADHLIGFKPGFKETFKGAIIIKHPSTVVFTEDDFEKIEPLITKKYGKNSITFLILKGYKNNDKNN